MQHFTKISLIYCTCYCIIDIGALKLTEISIPQYIDLTEKAQLSCKFEINRGKLYSVKWYKDEFEFFRFMPDNSPHIQTFPVDGVYLDISQSNKTTVTLRQLTFNSSGKYRCEVSKDGPNFETVVRQKEMTVMAYPKEGPIITGVQSRYSIGEWLVGNCTASPSNPAANLSWYINNKKADSFYLDSSILVPSEGLLYSKSLGIRLLLLKDHFVKGPLELRCSAKIADLPPWERTIHIHADSLLPDGIQAQNRVNNLSPKQIENFNVLTVTVLLYCLYFVYM